MAEELFLGDIADNVAAEDKNLHIYFLLDNSGSMQNIKTATISAVNEFIVSQQLIEDDVDTTLTLAKFGNSLSVVSENTPIAEVENLTPATYAANGGGTALYDAIGASLDNLEKITTPNQNVMMVIMTDGEENSSKEFKKQQIFDKITKLSESNKWTFVFLGANQDSYQEGSSIGLKSKSAANWNYSDAGVKKMSMGTGLYAGATRSHIASTGTVDATLDVAGFMDDADNDDEKDNK